MPSKRYRSYLDENIFIQTHYVKTTSEKRQCSVMTFYFKFIQGFSDIIWLHRRCQTLFRRCVHVALIEETKGEHIAPAI